MARTKQTVRKNTDRPPARPTVGGIKVAEPYSSVQRAEELIEHVTTICEYGDDAFISALEECVSVILEKVREAMANDGLLSSSEDDMPLNSIVAKRQRL